jgi:glycosyltransferase involved in cell wall biosynthesis
VPSTLRRERTSGRPRVFYISHDGVSDPLGRSQVLGYLERLAAAHDITLFSFEKTDDERPALTAHLRGHGIEWVPLPYHRRPPVASTAYDIAAGVRAVRRAARRDPPDIVHVRSYVAALIATRARLPGAKLLFDIRGFWADERVDGALWRRGGALHRVAKRCERRFFAEADGIVTLTEASVPQIRAWTGDRPVPIDVIPTCVDPARFAGRQERPGGPHAVWAGSIGTWYRFDLAGRVAAALSLPLTVITRQEALAREVLDGRPAEVRSAAPEDVPRQLFAGDVGLCLIVSSFSKLASAPTRFAEYLAAGMPVLVTPGVGDLERLVEDHAVGAVLRGEDDASIAAAAARLRALAADPAARERCRRLAVERFDVASGSARYAEIYRGLVG